MEFMDNRQLYTPGDCTSMQYKIKEECDRMSIVHDHKDNHKVGGENSLVVTKGQFCAMFIMLLRERETKFALNAWKSRSVRSGI